MSEKYGELIKRMRIKHKENMGDMADWLGVKLPFVSACENGKKRIPDDWLEKIAKHYKLNEREKTELAESIDLTRDHIKIDLAHISDCSKRAAFCFQRSIKIMDDDTAEKIIKLLEGDH